MEIVMTATAAGAPDHLNARSYNKGETFVIGSADMPDWLAENFLADGVARRLATRTEDVPPRKPRVPGPSETKGG